jgi:hypothetical protein
MFFKYMKNPFLKGFFYLLLLFLTALVNAVEIKKCSTSDDNRKNCIGKIQTVDGTYYGEIFKNKQQGFGALLNDNNDFFSGYFEDNKKNGLGKMEFYDGSKYLGNFKNDVPYGYGVFHYFNGDRYIGEFDGWKRNGIGTYIYSTGVIAKQGLWENDRLVKKNKSSIEALSDLENSLIEDINKNNEKMKEYKKNILSEIKYSSDSNLNFMYGYFSKKDKDTKITIVLSQDVLSLTINEIAYGGLEKGTHLINYSKFITTKNELKLKAISKFGNIQEISLNNDAELNENSNEELILNPQKIKKIKNEDAVAIIIGIEKYKNISEASFSNNDAIQFKEYATRSLGIAQNRIKLHLDRDAEKIEILKTLKIWLPTQVNSGKTDIYIFYSGHGLPSYDGKGFYILPHDSDTDFLDETAIKHSKLIEEIQKLNPKSVKIFLDSCFVGQNKQGETILPGARPILLRSNKELFPSNFTVLAASGPNQISWSSQLLKHGIFSFYLMKGMEGDADKNKDGEINATELANYLKDNVAKQAALNNHIQNPQLIGDGESIILGKKNSINK